MGAAIIAVVFFQLWSRNPTATTSPWLPKLMTSGDSFDRSLAFISNILRLYLSLKTFTRSKHNAKDLMLVAKLELKSRERVTTMTGS